ncbi:MAG: hypothetical protein NTU61_02630 [Candidatus Altiarchaeota archaeon]|nr:hypothetical protein [Candidatus Altiarchaeota archaeon]
MDSTKLLELLEHEISEFITEKPAPRKEVMSTNTHIILKEFKRAGILMFDEDAKRLPLSP